MTAPIFNWPAIYASFKQSALSKQSFYDQRLAEFVPGNRKKPTIGLMITEFNKIEETLKTVSGTADAGYVSVVDLEESPAKRPSLSTLTEIQVTLPDGTVILLKTADPTDLVLRLHEQCGGRHEH